MRIALGHAEELPLSNSDLDEPSWRALISIVLVSGMMMGEAMARPAKKDRVKNFMLGYIAVRGMMMICGCRALKHKFRGLYTSCSDISKPLSSVVTSYQKL